MTKAPAFQFYVKDWMADLAEHPLEIEGAWCRFCAKAWLSETRGELSYTLDQWSRLWRVSLDDAARIIRYIVEEKIGDSALDLTEISRDYHGKIHLCCRRMAREEKDKEDARIRQRRHYEKKKGPGIADADSHENLTPPSSSASASALNKDSVCPPLPPEGGQMPGPALPPSPEDDPDALPANLDSAPIEFQELARVYRDIGGYVDFVPAYRAYHAMRHRFPLARIADDLETRKDWDRWKRGIIPNLSNYLTNREWLNPIPAARASPSRDPTQALTYRQCQDMERRQEAESLRSGRVQRGTDVGNHQGGIGPGQRAPVSPAAITSGRT